jgi:hypothetical protein
MLAVLDARGEDQDGVPLARVLDDLPTRRSDEVLIVHELLDLARDVLAATHVQLVGVGLQCAGAGPQRTQVALHDQLAHPDLVADGVQDVVGRADRPAFHPERRGSEANHAHLRVDYLHIGQELPVHTLAVFRNEVTFIDDHQIDGTDVAGLLVHRLNAGNRDGVAEVAAL